jgi:hypothetical protein
MAASPFMRSAAARLRSPDRITTGSPNSAAEVAEVEDLQHRRRMIDEAQPRAALALEPAA